MAKPSSVRAPDGAHTYRRLLSYVKPYRKQFGFAILGMIAYSSTDIGFAALMKPMLDGSFVRMPFRGWYVNDENKTNMELNGCPPDYPVENLPSEYAKGEDSQIEKAIEVGLGLID